MCGNVKWQLEMNLIQWLFIQVQKDAFLSLFLTIGFGEVWTGKK